MSDRYPPIEFEWIMTHAVVGLCILASVYAAAIYSII